MHVDLKLQNLRKNIRRNGKTIVDDIASNHIRRINGKAIINKAPYICCFCGSRAGITREHILPQWVFNRDATKFFITDVNQLRQKYMQATVPACEDCNNGVLSSLENYIKSLLAQRDLNSSYFNEAEESNIIRWLEILDYKFQILDIVKRFLTSPTRYIPYLADFPLAMIRDKGKDDYAVLKELRIAQKRLCVRSKAVHLNSLMIIKTKNQAFHFLHQNNDFIFLELPSFNKAVFYFYERLFIDSGQAQEEAKKVLKFVY